MLRCCFIAKAHRCSGLTVLFRVPDFGRNPSEASIIDCNHGIVYTVIQVYIILIVISGARSFPLPVCRARPEAFPSEQNSAFSGVLDRDTASYPNLP